ncbi:hypothetical protein [Leptothermofonsia sp. ETS-13]
MVLPQTTVGDATGTATHAPHEIAEAGLVVEGSELLVAGCELLERCKA